MIKYLKHKYYWWKQIIFVIIREFLVKANSESVCLNINNFKGLFLKTMLVI